MRYLDGEFHISSRSISRARQTLNTHDVNKLGYDPLIASLRTRSRKDGTTYHAVLYWHDGRQTSTSFEDLTTAAMFKDLVDVVGSAKAPASVGADQHPNRVSANPPPPTTAARKIEARASCN